MIRVEFPVGVMATLSEDLTWETEGREPSATLLAAELNALYGPTWDHGADYIPTPHLSRAEAAAEAFRGRIVEDTTAEDDDEEAGRVY